MVGENILSNKHWKPKPFKEVILEEEYKHLLNNFSGGEFSQSVYFYFDTDREQKRAMFFKNRLRLRVKLKNGILSLELKIGGRNIEFRQVLSNEEFILLLQGNVPEGEIKSDLISRGFHCPVLWLGNTITLKYKKPWEGGFLVAEKVFLQDGNTDYELEFRYENIPDTHTADFIKKKLGYSFNKKRKPKVERFWESIK